MLYRYNIKFVPVQKAVFCQPEPRVAVWLILYRRGAGRGAGGLGAGGLRAGDLGAGGLGAGGLGAGGLGAGGLGATASAAQGSARRRAALGAGVGEERRGLGHRGRRGATRPRAQGSARSDVLGAEIGEECRGSEWVASETGGAGGDAGVRSVSKHKKRPSPARTTAATALSASRRRNDAGGLGWSTSRGGMGYGAWRGPRARRPRSGAGHVDADGEDLDGDGAAVVLDAKVPAVGLVGEAEHAAAAGEEVAVRTMPEHKGATEPGEDSGGLGMDNLGVGLGELN
uniref:Uncharacterized protein n=1 Tax=Ananas comosus var. bracteatus TaxID=296719 RepID=A0A6V7Q9Q1_ANACO|nr:unnamed protein product [Ananas comosus var. bracteatus]